jgi:hypothetical protein
MSRAALGALFLTSAALCGRGPCLAEETDPELDGKPLSTWVKQLRSDNRGLQLRAAKTLATAQADQRTRVLALLIPVLKSDRENDKFVAAQVLGEFGPAARAGVSDLLPLLQGTQYERNRAAAAKALGQILKSATPCTETEAVTRELVRLFDDKYLDVRREAVAACGTIGLAAKSCIPDLARRIGDAAGPDSIVRDAGKYAVWACGEFGPLAACHMDRLISAMHGGPVPETIEAVGKIGAVQDNVVPNIVDRMERVAAGTVMVREGDRLHVMSAELIQANMEKGFGALERFGPKSSPAVPYLARLVSAQGKEWKKPYVLGSLKVLRAVGPQALDAAPAIVQSCLASPDGEIKLAAEQALGAIRGK